MTKLDLTLNDCQTIESQVINRPQPTEGVPLQERDVVNISLDEVVLNKQSYITMQLTQSDGLKQSFPRFPELSMTLKP